MTLSFWVDRFSNGKQQRTRKTGRGGGSEKSDRLCPVLWLTVSIPRLCGRKHQRPLGPDRLSHSSSLTDSTSDLFFSFFFLIGATLNPLLPVWLGCGGLCVGFSCTGVTCSVTPEHDVHLIGRHSGEKRKKGKKTKLVENWALVQ